MTRQEPVAEAIAWHVCGEHYDDLPESGRARIQRAVTAVLAAIGGETHTDWGVRWSLEHEVDVDEQVYRDVRKWTEAAAKRAQKNVPTATAFSRQRTTFPDHVGPWTRATDDTDTDGEGS